MQYTKKQQAAIRELAKSIRDAAAYIEENQGGGEEDIPYPAGTLARLRTLDAEIWAIADC